MSAGAVNTTTQGSVSGLDDVPFVSVVIPVFNDSTRLRRCLEALDQQTYPHQRYEVIVVDNGSSEDVRPVLAPFKRAVAASESTPGSYAARNAGLRLARGEIIAFTDSDCIPQADWLMRGVDRLSKMPEGGLVGGRIALFFQRANQPTSVELFESVTAFPQQKYVQKYHYGATANVFTWRWMFDRVGMFDASLKSGGDREWGQRAFAAGFPIIYAEDVVIQHPARTSFGEMAQKVVRVTSGMERLRAQHGYPWPKFAKAVIKDLIPPKNDIAEIWSDSRLKSVSQRIRATGVLLGLRYTQAWARISIRMTRANHVR